MYAIIDIGSNSIRLVIYNIVDGKIVPLLNKKDQAGLAGYIENGKLIQKGIDNAIDVLKQFAQVLTNIKIKEVFVFATASIRNVDNTNDVIAQIKKKTGFDIDVITGDQEATFDYYGAVQTVDNKSGLLVDIGGGSTELVFFKDRMIYATYSLPIGSLNMYKQYVDDIVPTMNEIEKIEEKTTKLLKELNVPEIDFGTLNILGVGGSCRASFKFFKEYSQNKIEDFYDTRELNKLRREIASNPRNITNAILKFAPERIHTFIPGVTILRTIAKFYDSETVCVSNYGVREGYLLYVLEERGEINV